MPFGISGGTSSSNSSASSFDISSAGNVAGGVSGSSSQDVIAFEDIFAQMFGGAAGAAGGLDPSMLTEAANGLFSGGSQFLEGLGNDAGTQYMEDRLSGDNDVLQQQIDLLGEDLGSFFNEQLLPGITSDAVSGGTLGGGRQGVAQGAAAEHVGNLFTKGSTALRAGDIGARDAIAGNLAGNDIDAALAGFSGMGDLFGIAQGGFSAELLPFQLLSSILGGPTTLNSSESSSANFAEGFSNSYGTSQANSSSSSSNVGIGFGG